MILDTRSPSSSFPMGGSRVIGMHGWYVHMLTAIGAWCAKKGNFLGEVFFSILWIL